jgi:phage gp36-like protein
MPYATQQQATDRYGADALLVIADRDGDGVIDADVLDQALADASAEIDTYLAARYQLPLATVPEVLVRLCVDITVYRLAADADMATDERRKRYEDAVALLVRISKGDVSLGLPVPPPSSNGVVSVTSQPRRFGRGSGLRGL